MDITLGVVLSLGAGACLWTATEWSRVDVVRQSVRYHKTIDLLSLRQIQNICLMCFSNCSQCLEESCRDDGEEWERHEAFHDDVTSQERSKERLFEEEIELKWEKGGSGLVFYTGSCN